MRFASAVLFFVLSFTIAHGSPGGREGYKKLVELFTAGKYGEVVRLARDDLAVSDFEKLILAKAYEKLELIHQSNNVLRKLSYRKSPFKVPAAYFLGRNYEKLGDSAGALRWYRNALEKTDYPSGNGYPSGSLTLSADCKGFALAAMRQVRNIGFSSSASFDAASKILLGSASDYTASYYHLGVLYLSKGNLNRAAGYFIEKIRNSESRFYSRKSLEALTRDFKLIESANSQGLSKQEMARLCLEHGLYRNSLIVSYSMPYDSEVARLRARCFSLMEDYTASALLYGEYYAQFKDPEALLDIALAYYSAGNKKEAEISYRTYLKTQKNARAENAEDGAAGAGNGGDRKAEAFALGLRLERDGMTPEDYLIKVERFAGRYGSFPGLDRIIQDAFYYALGKRKPSLAVSFLQKTIEQLKDPLYRSWGAYVLALYRDDNDFDDAPVHFPGSFYYHMAVESLTAIGDRVADGDLLNEAEELFGSDKFESALPLYIRLYGRGVGTSIVKERIQSILLRDALFRSVHDIATLESGQAAAVLKELFDLRLYEELEEILEQALGDGNETEDIYYYYLRSKIRYSKNDFFDGLRNAELMIRPLDPRYVIFLPPEVLQLLYPRAYLDVINGVGSESGRTYDQLFVLSIIREESRYNERAESARGALGLMQLLPSTARWIRKENVSPEALFDPSVNIRTGILYLNYLVERFESPITVLAAYNGGPANVRRWLASSSHGNELKFIEEIPFLETKLYIKKVLTSYAMYRSLYGEQIE